MVLITDEVNKSNGKEERKQKIKGPVNSRKVMDGKDMIWGRVDQ